MWRGANIPRWRLGSRAGLPAVEDPDKINRFGALAAIAAWSAGIPILIQPVAVAIATGIILGVWLGNQATGIAEARSVRCRFDFQNRDSC